MAQLQAQMAVQSAAKPKATAESSSWLHARIAQLETDIKEALARESAAKEALVRESVAKEAAVKEAAGKEASLKAVTEALAASADVERTRALEATIAWQRARICE